MGTHGTTHGTKALLVVLLVPGVFVLLLAINAYIATGFNLGWKTSSTILVYAGLPISDVTVVLLTAALSQRKLRALTLAVWILNGINVAVAIRGGLGFY